MVSDFMENVHFVQYTFRYNQVPIGYNLKGKLRVVNYKNCSTIEIAPCYHDSWKWLFIHAFGIWKPKQTTYSDHTYRRKAVFCQGQSISSTDVLWLVFY